MAREEFITVTEKDNVRVFVVKAHMRYSDAKRLGRLEGKVWLRPKNSDDKIVIVEEVKDAVFEDIVPEEKKPDTSTEK